MTHPHPMAPERPSLVWLLTWLHDIGRHTEDHPVSWTITCSPQQARDAADYIAALSRPQVAGDYVVAPKEPTPEQITAGKGANPTVFAPGTDRGFLADVAHDVYRAMLAATSSTSQVADWNRAIQAEQIIENWLASAKNGNPPELGNLRDAISDALRATLAAGGK